MMARLAGALLVVIMGAALPGGAGGLLAEARGAQAAQAPGGPAVVVSIKPLHSLSQAILDGVADVGLIVDGTHSHHGFRLVPSKVRMLSRARLVVWLGRAGEPALARAIEALGDGRAQLAALELDVLQYLPQRGGRPLGGAGGAEQGRDDHGRGAIDSHIWLSPDNMAKLADVLAGRFVRLFPDKADAIESNRRRVRQQIEASARRIRTLLQPVRTRPFAVLHDAYQYFEKAYGLNNAGVLLALPGTGGSLRRIGRFIARLKRAGVVCLFVEPQFSDRLARLVAQGRGIRVAMLDPLGATLPPGPALFLKIGENLAASMRTCLQPAAAR